MGAVLHLSRARIVGVARFRHKGKLVSAGGGGVAIRFGTSGLRGRLVAASQRRLLRVLGHRSGGINWYCLRPRYNYFSFWREEEFVLGPTGRPRVQLATLFLYIAVFLDALFFGTRATCTTSKAVSCGTKTGVPCKSCCASHVDFSNGGATCYIRPLGGAPTSKRCPCGLLKGSSPLEGTLCCIGNKCNCRGLVGSRCFRK